jgi:predicted membrane protein
MLPVTIADPRQKRQPPKPPQDGWHPLVLIIGIGVALTLTAYPFAAARAGGAADHPGLLLLVWAMSAGLVRGVGFVPDNIVLRIVFSAPACLLALAAGIWRLASV